MYKCVDVIKRVDIYKASPDSGPGLAASRGSVPVIGCSSAPLRHCVCVYVCVCFSAVNEISQYFHNIRRRPPLGLSPCYTLLFVNQTGLWWISNFSHKHHEYRSKLFTIFKRLVYHNVLIWVFGFPQCKNFVKFGWQLYVSMLGMYGRTSLPRHVYTTCAHSLRINNST